MASFERSSTATAHLRVVLNQFCLYRFSQLFCPTRGVYLLWKIITLYERYLPTNEQAHLVSLKFLRITAAFDEAPVLFVTLTL
jgi:hypothetical protein